MSNSAISAHNLSKRYRIGALEPTYRTLRDKLSESLAARFRSARHLASKNGSGSAAGKREGLGINSLELPAQSANGNGNGNGNLIWALKDVSFEVGHGEVVGIIGRNGAGKSTLLKVLSRITEPTEGYADINGRLASLLEVGTGFHPELTGRENIFLNGSILGMRRTEIQSKFDEIVAFAEVEKFIDTPVKYYSSGMYVRLAFAVAAHLEPEILLIDEVLAVGDAVFQKKCLGKMNEVAQEGRTVLFVSHNLQAISTITRRAILIDGGRIEYDGNTSATLEHYRRGWSSNASGEFVDNHKATGVTRAVVRTSKSNQIHQFGKPLTFEFDVNFESKPRAGAFSFQIVDEDMRAIMDLWLFNSDQPWAAAGPCRLRCTVPKPRIYMGRYSITTWLSDRATGYTLESLQGICPFEIVMDDMPREFDWAPRTCTYLEDSEWEVL